MNDRNRSAGGFTLIELMIAMVLGLLLLAGMAGIFVSSSRNYRQDEFVARMQDDLRFGLAQVSQDLEMAGFFTTMHRPRDVVRDATIDTSIGPPLVQAIGTDCGRAGSPWAYDVGENLDGAAVTRVEVVEGLDNVTGATANAAFGCIASSDVVPGSDIIAIKRVVGQPTTTLTDGTVFLRALITGGGATMMLKTSSTAALPVTHQDWQYMPTIYFVRPYTATVGDGIPALCRKRLTTTAATPTFQTENGCLATGIETMQIEYGIDASGDGIADTYAPGPATAAALSATPGPLQRAVAVRVFLLGRSAEEDPAYTNLKAFYLSNYKVTSGAYPSYVYTTPTPDHYYRKGLSSTVLLRNPESLSAFERL